MAPKSASSRSPALEQCLKSEAQYDSRSLAVLHASLDDQCKNNTYDAEVNLAILKLYAIHPSTKDFNMMKKVLIKAIMAYPSTDFSLCMYLIPESCHEGVKDVTKLANLLEAAKFKLFWQEAASVDALKQAKGWEDKVRAFMANVVTATYRGCSLSTLAEIFNLKEGSKELDGLIKSYGWTKEGKRVSVNPNLLSAPEAAEKEESKLNPAMSLDEYKKLMQTTCFGG